MNLYTIYIDYKLIHRCALAVLLCLIINTALSSQFKDTGLKFILQETGYDGGMLFYDSITRKYTSSNRSDSRKKVNPGSTFDIFNTLMFLEINMINLRLWSVYT